MKQSKRDPRVGDQILILRCADRPEFRFEVAEITQISDDGATVRAEVEGKADGDGKCWLGRDDFILRRTGGR